MMGSVQTKRAPRGGNLSGARTNNHGISVAKSGEEVKMTKEEEYVNRLSEIMLELADSGCIDPLSIMIDLSNPKSPTANIWLYNCIDKVESSLGKRAQLEVTEGKDSKYLYKTIKCCGGSVVIQEMMGVINYARN